VLGALEMSTGAWVYRLGRRCAADFIALLDQLLQAFPHAPAIVVICDNRTDLGRVEELRGQHRRDLARTAETDPLLLP
jgi:hypothetical protein